uniref:Uncharacterized protein n=1 Tax=Oryza glaberrima TaxID=4538 RepID=I1QHQ5_ORYGL
MCGRTLGWIEAGGDRHSRSVESNTLVGWPGTFDELRSTGRRLGVALGSFGSYEGGMVICRLRLAARLTGGQSEVGAGCGLEVEQRWRYPWVNFYFWFEGVDKVLQ